MDASTQLPLTHVVYHILLVLTGDPRHGYGIIKDVADATQGAVEIEAGTLYAALKRLRDEAWIAEVDTPLGADARRRYYTITEVGRAVLEAESMRLASMVDLARRARLIP